MPIFFQYRNIRHILGMYITKQAEQEIYLIAQESNDGAPPTHAQLLKLPWMLLPVPVVCWIAPDEV